MAVLSCATRVWAGIILGCSTFLGSGGFLADYGAFEPDYGQEDHPWLAAVVWGVAVGLATFVLSSWINTWKSSEHVGYQGRCSPVAVEHPLDGSSDETPIYLMVTLCRMSTDSKGEDYMSPVVSYRYDLATPEDKAVADAKRRFAQWHGAGAEHVYDSHMCSLGKHPHNSRALHPPEGMSGT